MRDNYGLKREESNFVITKFYFDSMNFFFVRTKYLFCHYEIIFCFDEILFRLDEIYFLFRQAVWFVLIKVLIDQDGLRDISLPRLLRYALRALSNRGYPHLFLPLREDSQLC